MARLVRRIKRERCLPSYFIARARARTLQPDPDRRPRTGARHARV